MTMNKQVHLQNKLCKSYYFLAGFVLVIFLLWIVTPTHFQTSKSRNKQKRNKKSCRKEQLANKKTTKLHVVCLHKTQLYPYVRYLLTSWLASHQKWKDIKNISRFAFKGKLSFKQSIIQRRIQRSYEFIFLAAFYLFACMGSPWISIILKSFRWFKICKLVFLHAQSKIHLNH